MRKIRTFKAVWAVHEGHRQRVKERFLREGLLGFADHEVLELLLFFADARRDVNPLAHELVARFGSLDGVLSASYEALMEVPGVGSQKAMLLSLISPLIARISSGSDERPRLLSVDEAARYIVPILERENVEHFHIFCLNISGVLIYHERLSTGSNQSVPVKVASVLRAAMLHDAYSVIIAHNHPGGAPEPSLNDQIITKELAQQLRALDIPLADHIIVSRNSYYSFKMRTGILDMRGSDPSFAAQYSYRAKPQKS